MATLQPMILQVYVIIDDEKPPSKRQILIMEFTMKELGAALSLSETEWRNAHVSYKLDDNDADMFDVNNDNTLQAFCFLRTSKPTLALCVRVKPACNKKRTLV
jgi:hypothetical protein